MFLNSECFPGLISQVVVYCELPSHQASQEIGDADAPGLTQLLDEALGVIVQACPNVYQIG